MMKQHLTILLLSLLALTACKDDQKKYVHRMVGDWNIVREDTWIIQSDGTRIDETTNTNIGSLRIYESEEFDDVVYRNYDITFPGAGFSLSGRPFKTDETNKRVFFHFFFCEELFGCDWVGTIEENTPNRQVWTFYRRRSNGMQRYTWTLERE